ncbi:hypothetical protein MICRO116_1100007 [Micrococcus sp. 116]|nr:hypothetical protein MICRO116_1100007 [Micrococcus sp. 116]
MGAGANTPPSPNGPHKPTLRQNALQPLTRAPPNRHGAHRLRERPADGHAAHARPPAQRQGGQRAMGRVRAGGPDDSRAALFGRLLPDSIGLHGVYCMNPF